MATFSVGLEIDSDLTGSAFPHVDEDSRLFAKATRVYALTNTGLPDALTPTLRHSRARPRQRPRMVV